MVGKFALKIKIQVIKKTVLMLLLISLPVCSYAEDGGKVIILKRKVLRVPQTKSVVSLDYLQVLNNELYVCSENSNSGTCYYKVYQEGAVVKEGTVLLPPYNKVKLEVKSLPKGSYIIEVETPSNFISTDMLILERFYLRY